MKRSSLSYVFAAGLALGFYQAPAEAISIGFQPVAQTIIGGDAVFGRCRRFRLE